jgi:predicted nucleotide-binding protein
MINVDTIKEKVTELDTDADTIESEMVHFFSSIESSSNSNIMGPGGKIIEIPIERKSTNQFWREIDGDLAEYHRFLIKHYETWYNQGIVLIQNYNKVNASEFIAIHDGKREQYTGENRWHGGIETKMVTVQYGISELLQLNETIRSRYKPKELLKILTSSFSKQRAFIITLPEIIKFTHSSAHKSIKNDQTGMINNSVFIVHGHDEEMKQTVARFIEKMGLDAIILHEKENQGRHLLKKLRDCSNVGYAIVLLSPDDIGMTKLDFLMELKEHPENVLKLNYESRARQNVIFELGFFIALLGDARVCALVRSPINRPTDYDGIAYIEYDEHGAWKVSVLKELKSLNYNINVDKAILS